MNADKVEELVALIRSYQPDAVLNVALPYQDLTIMEACLECKVDYIDTANYEPEDRLYLLHILIIPCSWRIVKDSKKRGLQLSWEADLIRA